MENRKHSNQPDYQKFLEESAEELYENATSGYISYLMDGTIVKLNKTLLNWLGYTKGDVVQTKKIQDLLTIGGKIFFETHMAPLLHMQGFLQEISVDLLRADGRTLPVLINAIQLYDDTGQPILNRLTLINITDRRKYEQELLLAKKKAEQISGELAQTNEELATTNTQLNTANEEIMAGQDQLMASNEELADANQELIRLNNDLDTFIYTASHDLKAPILNIEGLLKVLEREFKNGKPDAENVKHIYDMLYGSINRFKATIEDLTDVARINKSFPNQEILIVISEVLMEVLKDLAPQITEAGATISSNLGQTQIRFSHKNLKSILYNLISNSIKYCSPERKPVIEISVQEEENYQILTVTDNGLGIDMTQKEKIFALFQRLHSHVSGTGIGLFIVKRMMENAGGRIEVESQLDVGTTFKIFFNRNAKINPSSL